MDNIGGALGFQATLDIDKFTVSAQAMENQIKHVSSTAQAEVDDMDNSLLQFAQRGAAYITTYLVGQGMSGLLQSIVQTRGQFQQLEIAFETMLGSGTQAQALMDQMVQTAAKTPFDLMGVAGGAKQLLAYGAAADKVNDTLVRLGNIASGLSIPLSDIVYLYGTTMVQGRLYTQDVRQFTGRGIPLVRELAEMYGVTADKISEMVTEGKIGFPEVEKVINKLTNSGGQFYNLMEKQSASLTGMISNLEDSWASMLNEIGKRNQDLFAGAIGMASNLVEHYDDIIRILKAVALGYGTVKAGIVANTLVTKGYTGVALIDNTVRSAKLALMKAEASLTGQTKAQTDLMTAAEQAHVASLQAELTTEELANVQRQLRISTIAGLLTAQQQESLSILGLTASSEGYEAAALGILSVEQQEALRKTDLSEKSAIYKAALEQEVLTKTMNRNATLDAMRADVSAAAAAVEAAKQRAIVSTAAVEQARLDVYWAKASGDATAIAATEKKLEAAVEQQSITRKAALTAQSEFYVKKKALETAATRQSTVASVEDTAAKGAQSAATSVLSAVTSKATLAIKTLWTAMKTNPLGWIVTVLGLAVSAITLFTGKTKEAKTAQGEFQDAIKKQTDELHTMMAVLENTTSGTNSHRKALDKINELCKEYNVTLLSENSTLTEQKKKYDELTRAIRENTAEKIKAKYTEQAAQDRDERDTKALDQLQKSTKKFKDYQVNEYGDGYWYDVKSIQNASDALFEMIELDAKQAAEKLKNLTGEEYSNTYKELLTGITKQFQAATETTDSNMSSYSAVLEKYFSTIVESARQETEQVKNELGQIEAYGKQEIPVPVVVETDYTTLTFSELDTKIQDTQKHIDELNKKEVKLPADLSELQDLKDLLDKLNVAVDTKTKNLNTESGISARIKELKDERSNVEINSEKYKDLTKEINNLSAKLPSQTKGGENAQSSLSQKQLEAERAVEEARISIMEEGYEKRQALLDLEHKRNLDKIDKEEKDLIAARKKAGQTGLTEAETKGFADRRLAEDQSYSRAQMSLFDGEIDYKKEQYELYYQWVRNVGQEVADEHFASLIKEGTSFTSWIDQQIANLEAKKATNPAGFTDGDANALNQLREQQNEMLGTKGAMEQFQESYSHAIQVASTLAEKLQVVADAKKELESGDWNLNMDETTQTAYYLNKEEADYQKQLRDTLISDYQTYNEKLLSIQTSYQALLAEAEKEGNADRVALVKRGMADAISALNAEMLMGTESWKQLFSDLDSLTVEQIEKLVKEIQTKMNTADLDLNPADLKAVLDQLDKAKKKILDVHPFRAMKDALKDVFEESVNGVAKSAEQIQMEWSNLSEATAASFDFINDAIDSCDVLKDALGETGQAVMESLKGITMAGIAMAAAIKQAEKGSIILAAISLALQVVQAVFTFVDAHDKNLEKRIEKLQTNIEILETSYERLERAMNRTYWIYGPEEEAAHQKRIEAIQKEIDMYEQIQRSGGAAAGIRGVSERIAELKKELADLMNAGDLYSLYQAQMDILEQERKAAQDKLSNEQKKKDFDKEKIREYENQIDSIEAKMEDLKIQLQDTLAGTDVESAIDEFGDAIWDAMIRGENAVEVLDTKIQDMLKNAVKQGLKRQFLAQGVNEAVAYLAEAMKDNVLSDDERANFTMMANSAGDAYRAAIEGLGSWIKDVSGSEDPLKGAIASLSENTGDVIAGRLNAIVINQSMAMELTRQQLVYQAEIAANTAISAREIQEIKSDVRRIAGAENNLLSQGIA